MKIPLASTLKNRAASLNEDAKLLNGYVETLGDPKKGGLVYTEKRPAMDSAFELTAGTGQGIYVPNTPDGDGEPGVIIGDILTRAPTPQTKRLRFGVQPSDVALNTAISPSVTVTIRDSIGNIVNSTANVTVALGTNPTSATLGGTLTRAAVAGTATFNDLTLDRSGEDFTLRATSGTLNAGTSNSFDIATHLTFTVQPTDSTSGQTITAFEVTAQDSAGATDTNYNGVVTVSIVAGSGTIDGTTQVTAVNGVASFTDVSITGSDTFQLQAVADSSSTAYTPSRTFSDEFIVAPYILLAGAQGFATGFASGSIGSITPTTFNGLAITQLFSSSLSNETFFTLPGTLSQSFLTSLTVNGTTVLGSAASFSSAGGFSGWTWSGQLITVAAINYAVSIA